MRLVVLLIVWALAAPAQPTELDRIAREWMKERGFMGSVLVAKGGSIVHEKSYGFANIEWDIANTPATRFRLGSITKQFTATAVMQLAEAGKLSLDDSIAKYIPDAPEAWKPVTIHQLLNHTSGIPSYTGMPDFRKPERRRVPATPVEIVMWSKDAKLEFQPGEDWKYNNTGYVALGHIIEKASGEKYEDYLQKHIFRPLEMRDSGFDSTRSILKQRASGYGYGGAMGGYQNADFLDMSLPHAAGSLYSTVRDLYKWDRALYGEAALRKTSAERMFTPGKKNYGYGWAIDNSIAGHKLVGHGGGINGFSTFISRFPNDDALVVVLSNVENGDAEGLARNLSLTMFGEKVTLPWERKAIEVDPSVLSKYIGTYQLEAFKVAVTLENGKLVAQPDKQPKLELYAESATRFFVKVVDATIEFQADEMILRQRSAELRGKRIAP